MTLLARLPKLVLRNALLVAAFKIARQNGGFH